MFVGDAWDGSGIVNMVLELLANAYDHYLVGRCSRIRIDIGADGTICVSDDGPARDGLVGLVALAAPCALSEVASLKDAYETPNGPIDVEVALVWQRSRPVGRREPEIHSFVNLGRTHGGGSHVQGLIDGVWKHKGTHKRMASVDGLVAAVSVILADVKLGDPTRDRLDSPEARAPVADATQRALAARQA